MGKAWLRLHQEDLLQAMSYRPEKKYQADGGPSVKNVAMLFSTLALPDRVLVRSSFFDALAYNVLVGGTDAHAKNYSVLLRGPRVALSPVYDVASYAPHLKAGESLRSSMKVWKNWQVRDVTARDWTQAGAAFGLVPDEALARVERLRQGLPDATHERGQRFNDPHEGRGSLRALGVRPRQRSTMAIRRHPRLPSSFRISLGLLTTHDIEMGPKLRMRVGFSSPAPQAKTVAADVDRRTSAGQRAVRVHPAIRRQ